MSLPLPMPSEPVRHPVRFLASPHHNARPEGVGIDLVVLHAISLPSGNFDTSYVEDLFLGRLDTDAHPSLADLKGVQVSAHFVIDRAGQITQFVPVSRRAWHAGESVWQGRADCNDYAIGIEMIGDELQPFTSRQYTETARLCRMLMRNYPGITNQRIVGHQDVAPKRKWDPGRQWDWARFQRSLKRVRRLDLVWE